MNAVPPLQEAGLFYRTSSSVRIWWEFKEPKGPKGSYRGLDGVPDARARAVRLDVPHPARVDASPGEHALGESDLQWF